MKFNGRNVYIGKNVQIGKNVKIGDNTTIYDNVVIGDHTIICNDCVIGEPQYSYFNSENYSNPTLIIGSDSLIRSHCILYAGSSIGDHLQTGHYAIIRENNVIGNHCMVGSHCTILNGCKIGNFCRFHSYDEIGEETVIEDFVFFYPYVLVSTDPTPPSNTILPSKFGAYTQVLSNVMVMPGTHIGANCVVSACSRVGGKFKDNLFINGNPAKKVCEVTEAPIINRETGEFQYPWPYNFERNMPWEGIGFDEWLKQNNREL